MKNAFAQATNFFAAHQPRFNDFGFKMSDAESHYSFASLNNQFSQQNGFPFDVRIGFNFDGNDKYAVALFEVHSGNALENGTKLVRISSQNDLIKLFNNVVKPLCPAESFDGMLNEAINIFEAALIDFNEVTGDFEVVMTKAKPFFESYYTVSETHPDHHVAHIEFSTDGIYNFHATALVKMDGTQPKLKFVSHVLNTAGKLENCPAVGEAFSSKVQTKLNKMFYSNKYLCVRSND